MSESHSNRPKVLAVGIDGASFNLISPWLEQGELPAFERLMNTGAYGDLESCVPPVTMPAWRVYSTGKYPGKLGVFWHQQLDRDNMRIITPNTTHILSMDMWDYLNEAGYSSGIVGMPDTYPPKALDGFMVSGGPSVAEVGYTYPTDLAAELERELDYHPTLKYTFHGDRSDTHVVEQVLETIDRTFAAGEYLSGRYPVDFQNIVTFDINRLQHVFFDGEQTLEAWRLIDRWLSKLAPSYDLVVILSDHGTAPLERVVFLNAWLRQNGYLTTRFHPLDLLSAVGINATNVARLMQALGITRFFSFQTIVKYGSMLPRSSGGFGDFGNQSVAQRVDWTKTRVFALPQGPIYINRDLVNDDAQYEQLRAELIERMEALVDPISGKRVFQKVYRREELYYGDQVEIAPDLIALDDDSFHNRAGLKQRDLFAPSWRWRGNNRLQGLFVISGSGTRAGAKLSGVQIVDLAPTILHFYGVPIPNDLDGRVLAEAFEPGSAFHTQPITYQDPQADDQESLNDLELEEAVNERLRGLGYL